MKRLLAVLDLLSICALGQGYPRFTYAHLTQATANNLLASGPAELHVITVNSSTSGTIQIQDTTASNCTGGSVVAATSAALSAGATLRYDITTSNGLCIVTGGTIDVTVAYRINR